MTTTIERDEVTELRERLAEMEMRLTKVSPPEMPPDTPEEANRKRLKQIADVMAATNKITYGADYGKKQPEPEEPNPIPAGDAGFPFRLRRMKRGQLWDLEAQRQELIAKRDQLLAGWDSATIEERSDLSYDADRLQRQINHCKREMDLIKGMYGW